MTTADLAHWDRVHGLAVAAMESVASPPAPSPAVPLSPRHVDMLAALPERVRTSVVRALASIDRGPVGAEAVASNRYRCG